VFPENGDGAKIVIDRNFAVMRSILVIRLTSMGDVVLATPLLRQLRRTYPDARIDVAVADRFADVWANNPHVTIVWPVPSVHASESGVDELKLEMLESLSGEWGGAYDLIVDLQHSLRSATLRRGLGSTVVRAPKHRMEKLAMVYLKRRPAVTTSIVNRYRSTVGHLGLAPDTDGCEVWLPEEHAYPSVRPDLERMRVAIVPGAHHATKRWPAVRYAELAASLVRSGREVVLLGGPSDVELCSAVAAASGVPVLRADGATSIEATVRMLDSCSCVVTNDTGVMHLAAARRVPVVAIFGSTVRELGFAPYGTPHRIVEHDVACRPCSHIGRATCPKQHFLCMEGIAVSDVLRAVSELT
jgi:heptosyltransferase-2